MTTDLLLKVTAVAFSGVRFPFPTFRFFLGKSFGGSAFFGLFLVISPDAQAQSVSPLGAFTDPCMIAKCRPGYRSRTDVHSSTDVQYTRTQHVGVLRPFT